MTDDQPTQPTPKPTHEPTPADVDATAERTAQVPAGAPSDDASPARPSFRVRTAAALGTVARSRKVLVALGAVAVLAVAGTTWGYTAMSSSVTLSVDGEEREVNAMGGTVGEVLDDAGIDVGRHDLVAPDVDDEVQDGSEITVRLGRPVELTVDGRTQTHWVTATDVESALEEIGAGYDNARLSTSRGADIGLRGTDLEVVTPKRLTVSLAGAKPKKRTLPVLTVRDALRRLDVDLDRYDETKPGLGAEVDDGDEITWTDRDVDERTVKGESFSVPTITREDDSLTEGTEDVVREGSAGTRDATYRVVSENGKVVERKLLRSKVTDEAVAEIVAVGTAPAVETSTSGSTVWDSLAQCEAGGDWSINTGNGYYGGLQFNLQTWQAYGGTGLPSENSRETQIAIAEKVRAATGGYGSWPACAASLGLPT